MSDEISWQILEKRSAKSNSRIRKKPLSLIENNVNPITGFQDGRWTEKISNVNVFDQSDCLDGYNKSDFGTTRGSQINEVVGTEAIAEIYNDHESFDYEFLEFQSCHGPTGVGGQSKSFDLSDFINAHHAIKASGIPNAFGCKIPVYSRLNISFFRKLLANYWDRHLCDFLEFIHCAKDVFGYLRSISC